MSRIIYGTDEKIPGENSYDRCSYKGCKNGKYRLGGRKLFLFPSHTEPERREKWLLNCGNEELRKKADSSIRRSGLCSDHFDLTCFTDDKKYSLKRNSIPRPNYPPNLLIDESRVDSNRIIDNNLMNRKINDNVDVISNNISRRVPKLFVDDDDYDEHDINYEIINDIQENKSNRLNNEITHEDNNEANCKSKKSIDHCKLYLLKNNNEFALVTNKSSLYSTTAELIEDERMKEENISEENCESINTSMTTIELLRMMNKEQNKDKKIEKLMKQNTLLRKELKALKQNIRRWESRRQQKSVSVTQLTLKQQKRMVLNIVNAMGITPMAKAIISSQLHMKRVPHTEEKKDFTKIFRQYSCNNMKRLKNVPT
ncbi:hypothetical protein PV327_004373 [Microctonus hyperodae]|uniref:THAP-type domain-containing protein n=1 Tax=Microctonus hyperodae TaxID=165561 RepID=A0AA39KMK8_MICHY|nr:hypothetical protein PV327_004373 [Microctonus hyperodae]